MKKNLLFMMTAMLLTFGMFSACSSDDEMSALMDSKLSLFEDSLQSVPENDYTGHMLYNQRHGWYIAHSQLIDHQDDYFPLNLPEEFKEPGVKVSFSGKVIKLTDEDLDSLQITPHANQYFYFVYLTKIEKMEEEEIPYRGTPPFTITDMLGTVGYDWDQKIWFIGYAQDIWMYNRYYPTELSEEFQVIGGPNVIISGNVYEDLTDPYKTPFTKQYKIELTKIEKAE